MFKFWSEKTLLGLPLRWAINWKLHYSYCMKMRMNKLVFSNNFHKICFVKLLNNIKFDFQIEEPPEQFWNFFKCQLKKLNMAYVGWKSSNPNHGKSCVHGISYLVCGHWSIVPARRNWDCTQCDIHRSGLPRLNSLQPEKLQHLPPSLPLSVIYHYHLIKLSNKSFKNL